MTFTLNNVRLSYLNIEKPKSIADGETLYYSVSCILEKEQASKLATEIKRIIDEQKWDGKKLKNADKGLRDGDDKEDEPEYAGKYYINAKSTKAPLLIDRKKTPLPLDTQILYSGCYGNVQVSLYPYDKAGKTGVGFGLLAIQFVKDGERLGSSIDLDAFETLEDEEVDDILGGIDDLPF